MNRRAFLLSLGAGATSLTLPDVSEAGGLFRRSRDGCWKQRPWQRQCLSTAAPGLLYVSEAQTPVVDPKGEADSYSVKWNGRFDRNYGEMTGFHRVYMYPNDLGETGTIAARSDFCKNYGNLFTLRFGFLVYPQGSTMNYHIIYTAATLDLGESKPDADVSYRNQGMFTQLIKGKWHMFIGT